MEECNYFRFLEHTADVYVEVCGESLEKAFELAGKALFEVMTDTNRVRPELSYVIEDYGFDIENALYRWLEDLLIEYGRSNVVFGSCKVEYVRPVDDQRYEFRGVCFGEQFDPERHEARTEVKAVTYSLMEVRQREGGRWVLRFVLDI